MTANKWFDILTYIVLLVGVVLLCLIPSVKVPFNSVVITVTKQSEWPIIGHQDLKIQTKVASYQIVGLTIGQPYDLLSETPVRTSKGYAVLYANRYRPIATWLELIADGAGYQVQVNFKQRYTLNWDPNIVQIKPTSTPIKLKWITNNSFDSCVVSLPVGDTTSGIVLLTRLR